MYGFSSWVSTMKLSYDMRYARLKKYGPSISYMSWKVLLARFLFLCMNLPANLLLLRRCLLWERMCWIAAASSCYKSVSGTLMPFGNEHGGAYFGVVCFCVVDEEAQGIHPTVSPVWFRVHKQTSILRFLFGWTDKVAGLVCHSVRNPNFDTSICRFFFLEQTSP